LMKRMTGRATCGKCGEIYNTYFCPPKTDGVCDLDGASLVKRGDDRPEAVMLRLAAYHAMTEPLIAYYRQTGRLIDVDGGREVEEVFAGISRSIDAAAVSA